MKCKEQNLWERVKWMKWTVMLICLFSMPLCLTSCSDDEGDQEEALIGTWICSEEGWYSEITLNADGTFSGYQVDEGDHFNVSGSWSAAENIITMFYTGDTEPEHTYYRIDNNKLYFYETIEDYNNNKYYEISTKK